MITRIEKFGATWCGPCRVLDKTLEEVKGVEIVKYDVDEHEDLTASKGIRSIPVLIFYNEVGEEVHRTIGSITLADIIIIIAKLD